MRTKNLLTMAALAGTMTLGSCSNNDEVAIDNLKDTPILVNTGVNELTQTRAGYSDEVLPRRFALYITQDGTDAASPYNYKNVEMQRDGSTWTPGNLPGSTPMLWKSATPQATVIAYNYIGDGQLIYGEPLGDTELKLVPDQSTSTGIEKADVLYRRVTHINPEAGGLLNINFEHKGSKVILNCGFGNEVAAGATVTACTISGETGDNGTRTPLYDHRIRNASGDLQRSGVNNTATTGLKAYVEDNKAEFIIFSQQIESLKLTFTVSVGGATKTYTGIWNVKAEVPASRISVATITIGRDKITIGDITVSPWGTGNDTPGDLVTE